MRTRKSFLINEQAVRRWFSAHHPNIRQIDETFWDGLDIKLRNILARAARNNASRRRITCQELGLPRGTCYIKPRKGGSKNDVEETSGTPNTA